MMKRVLSLVMGAALAFGLSACGGGQAAPAKDSQGASQSQSASASASASQSGEGQQASSPASQQPKQGVHKIGVLAPQVTHGWTAALAYHAEKRCKALAEEGKIEYKVLASGNAAEMTAQLDELRNWGVEAIVVFPQWEGMEVPIQEAVKAGVKVVNFDLEINVDGIYRVAGDNYDMGYQGAKYIVDKIGPKGKVVILDVPSSGSVARLRKEGFLTRLKEIAPEMETVEYATKFSREAGLNDMADILTANPHVDAVYSMDDETSIGALQAIRDAGRSDIKVLTGGGGSQGWFQLMKDEKNKDIWLQSALYSPAMVEDAVELAVQILNGQEPKDKSTIIPTTIVDRENVDKYLDANSPY